MGCEHDLTGKGEIQKHERSNELSCCRDQVSRKGADGALRFAIRAGFRVAIGFVVYMAILVLVVVATVPIVWVFLTVMTGPVVLILAAATVGCWLWLAVDRYARHIVERVRTVAWNARSANVHVDATQLVFNVIVKGAEIKLEEVGGRNTATSDY